MRTIIAGSRTLKYHDVAKAMANCGWTPTVVISGGANGVDLAGELWAKNNNIPVEQYLADWNRYRKSAGYVRNSKMVSVAEALVAVWDGSSRGTAHIMKEATRKGLKVYITDVASLR